MAKWTDEATEWFLENYGDFATNRLAVDALDLPSGCTILDIGCGPGFALRCASVKVTTGRLIGVDPMQRMLTAARLRLIDHPAQGRIDLRKGDSGGLPLSDQDVDFVFAFDSFDYWANHAIGLKEVRRVLKPEGRLIVLKDWNDDNRLESQAVLEASLSASGFGVLEELDLQEGDVAARMWVCAARELV